MSGTRGGLGRIVAIGIALALALLMLAAKEATAGKYSVAQCGWHVGADAGWADSTGGAKFRSDSFCATPPGADPFDGAHLKSLTRDGQGTVSGTRYARWRWEAPAGTGITRVSGTWWHALHDGIEQRIGVATWGGGFAPFATASTTDTTARDFVAGFSPPQPALEDRLLCARAESKWCSVDPGSWSAVRALTITVEDDNPPGSSIDGDMLAGGWLRGERKLGYRATDVGAGLKRTEATIDGSPVFGHDHPCNTVSVSSELRATTMRPCPTEREGYYQLATTRFSDGPHTVGHCATDFAGNVNCLPPRQILIDNNPPAHPRELALGGGDAWRRVNDFDLTWANPDQAPASPIAGASWRIAGPAGYDSGAKFVAGRDLTSLNDLFAPHAGAYTLSVWLRDEAGNESSTATASLPLRFDDVPPGVAFEAAAGGEATPAQVVADLSDAHSGPASGEIHYRRLDAKEWAELPAKFQRGETADAARLIAQLPSDLSPGTYVFQAEALDAAGNAASTTRRADGTQMTVRKVAGDPVAGLGRAQPTSAGATGAKTRIYAQLRRGGRGGTELAVPFGSGATLRGRLLDAEGVGLGHRTLRVVSRPSRGALHGRRVDRVRTGPHGLFRLELPAGTSRRISVSFPGDERLASASRGPLTLRVRSGVELQVTPHQLHTGEAVHFSGHVRAPGAPIPRRGKLVAIQYREEATGHWRPILVTRTDHTGRFLATYRFRYITATATIHLRAQALPEERWPYAPGSSPSVLIHVSGF
ncbi:MAG TPA: Ig-like domain repeat protein [Solirubrobacterales bacterium]